MVYVLRDEQTGVLLVADHVGSSNDHELHTAFGTIQALLLITLVGFKYQGTANTLFKEHSLVTSLFIADIFFYVIAFEKAKVTINGTTSRSSTSSINNTTCTSDDSTTSYKLIFLISGAIGFELLLFILSSLSSGDSSSTSPSTSLARPPPNGLAAGAANLIGRSL